ncbi:hypothetical protein QQX98_009310 [Neonectria punicea]|uniref:Killer toxin Kp4 domain-containing protein n=1 Tax=Neonectria punicea TaxID=979145 RepID=A0ABR1GT74_9HYPO
MALRVTYLLLAYLGSASATGINCQGNSGCGLAKTEIPRMANILNGDGASQGIADDRWYKNGEHIYCGMNTDSWSCAFLQKSGGAPGKSIKKLIRALADHNCVHCGSVPLFFPQDNNVENGELTVNIINSPNGCNGVC